MIQLIKNLFMIFIFMLENHQNKKYNNSKMVKNCNLAVDNFLIKIIKKLSKFWIYCSGSLDKKVH